MKKIFVLTGEPSGDKLASEVISQIKTRRTDLEFLSVGGTNLEKLGIKTIYDQKEITYIAFTDIILNFFKIKRKIKDTVNEVLKFNPDILFSVDSPDFTLRVAKLVKEKNSKIKIIHFIAPKVWAWREGRVKKMKKFLDHILLLFKFEKEYFDKEKLTNTFVGHPLLDKNIDENVQINQFLDKKNIISIFPGSRVSEISHHMPILINFVKKMNIKDPDYNFIFHATDKNKELLSKYILNEQIQNIEIISDDKIKTAVLKKSNFAVVKSGTVSLEVCKMNVPSIIIYKMNFINFYLAKFLLNLKFVNMVNIINNKEVIPELIQSECNADEIFKSVYYFLKKPDLIDKQKEEIKKTLKTLTSPSSSSEEASNIILSYIS
ncbi:lipid-A-disaccharide synthase [Pelagibacterales bacterium SAG-MED17]|nr:lipid-A-disaccharide synthase [Pelagibacterales bacterium SAG-MED17]